MDSIPATSSSRAAKSKSWWNSRLLRRARSATREGPPRSVRAAYRRLLRRGATLGHARATAETPREYLDRLARVPIPAVEDAAQLTTAYMVVHYGGRSERAEDIEQVQRSWERLDRATR